MGCCPPILFTIYIDEMLHVFQKSHLECHIGNTFWGDVILIAPSFHSLNNVLAICQKFADEYYVLFYSSELVEDISMFK